MLNEIGFVLSAGQLYALTAVSGLACGLLRLVFMFLPPILGTRKLVTLSALLFLLPMFGWFSVVQRPDASFAELLAISFASGIGGGVFSGLMPSTGYFFPKRMSGTALGLQAGIGNFGISFIQLVAPWLMGFSLIGIDFVAPQRMDDVERCPGQGELPPADRHLRQQEHLDSHHRLPDDLRCILRLCRPIRADD